MPICLCFLENIDMFFDEPFHKTVFIKFCPKRLASLNNNNSNTFISLPTEDNYICSQNSYLGLESEVLKNDNTRYADID